MSIAELSQHSSLCEYIAGFIDGDGMINMPKPTEREPWPKPRISISQSCNSGKPPELEFLRKNLGGSISIHKPSTDTARPEWILRVLTEDVHFALHVISNFGVLKREQANIAMQYLDEGRKDADRFAELLSQAKSNYHTCQIPEERLTDSYLAGLFVADGCVDVYKTIHGRYITRACITQVGCQAILHAIRRKLDFGNVQKNGKIGFSDMQAEKFLRRIAPHLRKCQKRRQVKLALRNRVDGVTTRDKKKIAKKIKKLKKR